MKINEKLINDIFSFKIKLKNKSDKEKLSSYEDFIPMYDIYTQRIYPISKQNLFFRLTESNYRFINHEVVKWIEQMVEKNLKKLKTTKEPEMREQIENLLERLTNMLKIIDNYDIDTLINVSYKVLYQYSTNLGLSVSICKRNSFNPYIFYLKPYYTKIELVKLGQNMGAIKKNVKPEDLIDIERHYEICKKISNNDVSFDEIKEHTVNIHKTKSIPDIIFYSFIGSTLLNRFLRTNTSYNLNKFFYDRLLKTVDAIKNSPPLENDYQIYRFIGDDEFIKKLKVGDTFTDKGFLSTTRDPFYSPGTDGNFGMILIKINLNKKSKGLFIEHFSLFPKEEEYLLPPFTKLKLISKDDHFKYYHINEQFEKNINKKYEFDLIECDFSWVKKVKLIKEPIPEIDYRLFNVKNFDKKIDLLSKLKHSTNKFNEIIINDKIFYVYYFDSLDAYSKYYFNKIEKGLSLIHYDENGNLLLLIEFGKEMVVNYINKFYFYENKEKIEEKYLIDLLTDLGLYFNYKSVKIFNEFCNFSRFKENYYTNQEIFLYINHFDNTLYQYAKNKIKPYKFETFYKNNFRKLDTLLLSKVSDDIKKKFSFNGKTVRELLIEVVEKQFYQYSNLNKIYELDNYSFGELNIYEKLISEGRIDTMLELQYSDDDDDDDDLYKLIYRQPIRRY